MKKSIITISILLLAAGCGSSTSPQAQNPPTQQAQQSSTNDRLQNNSMDTQTPQTQNGQADLQTKKVIIAAIIKGYGIFTSGNAKEIKNYFLEQAQTPEEKQQVQSQSDEDLLSTFAWMSVKAQPTEELLNSPDAQWDIQGDSARVKVETEKYSALKINGTWYASWRN